MEPLQAVPGTRDLFPADTRQWDRLQRLVADTMERFAYGRIETPHFESLELFARGVGAATDIVQKEMYVFEDRGGRRLALRPEGTAGVVRAFVEGRLDKQKPVHKLWYWGPMFRAERPQKGRYRQFWQFGVEAFGLAGPAIDAEQMALAMSLVQAAGVRSSTLRINSVGDAACRPAYKKKLVAFLDGVSAALCANCRRRITDNPMRVLDCKETKCRAVLSDAPLMADHLCDPCAQHYADVRALLTDLGIDYEEDGRIVRGLDYYMRTAFEVQSEALGAQSAIVGGGRYDGLVALLGGGDVPGVGWAAGIDRFLMTMAGAEEKALTDVFVAAFDETRRAALGLAHELRKDGIRAEIDLAGRSLKAQLKEAARLGARWAFVLGPDEWSRGEVTFRDLEAGEQRAVPVARARQLVRSDRV